MGYLQAQSVSVARIRSCEQVEEADVEGYAEFRQFVDGRGSVAKFDRGHYVAGPAEAGGEIGLADREATAFGADGSGERNRQGGRHAEQIVSVKHPTARSSGDRLDIRAACHPFGRTQ